MSNEISTKCCHKTACLFFLQPSSFFGHSQNVHFSTKKKRERDFRIHSVTPSTSLHIKREKSSSLWWFCGEILRNIFVVGKSSSRFHPKSTARTFSLREREKNECAHNGWRKDFYDELANVLVKHERDSDGEGGGEHTREIKHVLKKQQQKSERESKKK